MLVAELGDRLLVLLVQLGHGSCVVLQGQLLFFLAALQHRLIVIGVVVFLEIALRLGDQLGDLFLVLGLHRLGGLQILLVGFQLGSLLLGGIDPVPLQVVNAVLDLDDSVRTIHAQGVDLRLDAPNIFIDRLKEVGLLLSRKNFCVLCYHKQFLPL